ncbi:exonuclease III [Aquimarina sp. EL_43]|uniref:endonuclease/exonuclease/phosphatase family protein n=1 Tax=unclassified Aquimarina TaxID=2627091 RepID=UPI0018CAD0DD|nr:MULTISPECIES: endonuclease/exonuclease/phosphatase family protein [unclassified Aquimarina]MBG6133090.1 exonuclease III [Aquimarina sp. EL_35]MBG6153248.1 exonuclease III [Aquimarina sp. EL_32]MBG6171483.1 exonuclease III [Aquimarina sp. EL_43]
MFSKDIFVTLAFILLFTSFLCAQEKKEYVIHTIAFYNLENLFDPEDDPITFDDDRTPKGKDHWTYKLYTHKVKNMARTISEIGKGLAINSPAILGVAEIENRKVLEDLVNDPNLRSKDYSIVHFDSPDRRGIDVALLYQNALFKVKNYNKHELIIYDKDTAKRVFTRDQLLVSGYLDGDLIHIIVNHWPSRRGGEARSRYKREKAAALNKKIMDSLFATDPYAKIITMGDLNDNPNDLSVKKILKAKQHRKNIEIKGLYNPMAKLAKKGLGSLAWRDQWSLFDQIIISKSFLDSDYSSYRYYKAGVFNPEYLITPTGKYKGYPFRSYTNNAYTGGYSDHFPVYIYLIKQKR